MAQKVHRAAPPKGQGAPKRRKLAWLAILAGCLALALIGAFLVFGLSSCSKGGADAQPDSSASHARALNPQDYRQVALAEGEDAGMEYVKETLFLGDSNTQRMLSYRDVTGTSLQNSIGVVSMGIQSFTTHKCVQFEGDSKTYTMPEAVGILKPRRVVITFGSNNVGMEIDKFIGYYEEALEAIEESWPYADIIIGGVFPVDEYRQNTSITMKRIDEMNAALAALAKDEGCRFLGWHEALLDEENGHCQFEYTLQDGVHLTREGMETIFTYFRTHSYITQDTRPKELLKDIPQRVGQLPGIVQADPYKTPGPIDWTPRDEGSQAPTQQSSSTPQSVAQAYTLAVAVSDNVGGAGVTGGSTSLQVTEGQTVSVAVSAHASVVIDGVSYNFAGWSNGDANPRTTIAFAAPPATAPVYYIVATYVAAAPPVVEPPPASEPPVQEPPPASEPPVQEPPPVSEPPVQQPPPSGGEGEGLAG